MLDEVDGAGWRRVHGLAIPYKNKNVHWSTIKNYK